LWKETLLFVESVFPLLPGLERENLASPRRFLLKKFE
jgi:hypothetical protein